MRSPLDFLIVSLISVSESYCTHRGIGIPPPYSIILTYDAII